MEDGQLVRQALDGNRGAFATLVEHYTGSVRALCRAQVHRADVADLTQETFTRAWRQLRGLRDPDRFGPWLLGIARNLCRCWRRDVRRRLQPFTDVPPDKDGKPDPRLDPPAPDTAHDGLDDLKARVECVLRPWPRLLETFLLRYLEGISYPRLAELLDVSPALICKRLTRAREILRCHLSD
jgi:RNA polymerase sigma-70 factor (ECF subfamily)